MKKYIIVLLAICTLTMLASCSASEATEAFADLELVRWGEGNRFPFYNLEHLERCSEIVVVGTFIEDSTQELTYRYEEIFDKEILTYVQSFNHIEVKQVFKGDVNVGDTIKICQPYAIVDDRFVTDSALTPMMKGDTWIFFLEPSDNGEHYFCTSDSDGRYPVKDFSYARIALTENEDLGVFDESDFKKEIYEEILEKYEF